MNNHNKNTLKKNTIILVSFAIISKLLGIFREIFFAKYFGTTAQFDAYVIAINLPLIITNIFFGNIFISSIVSEIHKLQYNENEHKVKNLISSILLFITLFSLFIIILVLIFSSSFVHLLAPGFNLKTHLLAVKFIRISIFILLFMALSATFQGILNAKNHFVLPGLKSIILNSFILFFLLAFSHKIGVYSIILGFMIGVIVQFIIQIPKFFQFYPLKDGLGRFDKYLLFNFWESFFPFILVSLFHQLVLIVDKIVASTLGIGNISGLYFSEKLMEFPQSIIGLSLATVIFPTLSKYFNTKSPEKFNNLLEKSLSLTFFITFPITLSFLFLSKPLITFIFKRGVFNGNSVNITSIALIYYAFASLFITLNTILTKGLIAYKKIKSLLIVDFIAISLNILLNIVLAHLMGIGGIALATSISTFVLFLLFYAILKVDISIIIHFFHIGFVEFISFFVVLYFCKKAGLSFYNIFNLTTILFAIFAIIFILSKLFKFKELTYLTDYILKKKKFTN